MLVATSLPVYRGRRGLYKHSCLYSLGLYKKLKCIPSSPADRKLRAAYLKYRTAVLQRKIHLGDGPLCRFSQFGPTCSDTHQNNKKLMKPTSNLKNGPPEKACVDAPGNYVNHKLCVSPQTRILALNLEALRGLALIDVGLATKAGADQRRGGPGKKQATR